MTVSQIGEITFQVPRVLFRVDAGPTIGIGHVMRCAALANRLIGLGAAVTLASAGLPRSLAEGLEKSGIQIATLPPATDWQADCAATQAAAGKGLDLLVVDHYLLGANWEQAMRSHARIILAIDDLANRDHNCDLLLDQNLRDNAEVRYRNHVAPETRLFLGPRYALLRDEFTDPKLPRKRDGQLRRLLVFFGGTDPGNQSLKVIDALRMLVRKSFLTTIVLGPGHPDPAGVWHAAQGIPGLELFDSTTQMAQLMATADLALGTCGTAAWERCVLGLPSLVVITADNQREDAKALSGLGAVASLGEAEVVSAADWHRALDNAAASPDRLAKMSIASLAVMAGWQAAAAEFEQELCNALG